MVALPALNVAKSLLAASFLNREVRALKDLCIYFRFVEEPHGEGI